VLPVSPELSVEPSCPENSLSAGDDLAGWVLLLRARRSDPAWSLSFPGQPHRVAFRERAWLFMARTRSKPASPPVPGDAGAEVTGEPAAVISGAAAIDVAEGSGVVCLRLPHESGAGRRTQKVRAGSVMFSVRDALADALVWPGSVVMLLVFGQYGAQVRLAQDQGLVQDLTAQGAGQALADRVRSRPRPK
jgi:hypothetical protein